MNFTLRQLKVFESVARHNSYTKAAKELHLTQPAVSMQVKQLEENAGLPLLEQIGKKIYPTTAGKALYQASLDILSRVNELKDTVEELKGEVKGPLQVSVVTTSKYFMPQLLGAFLQRYPEVEPKLKFTNRANVVERLSSNIDDFVVMGRLPDNKNFDSYPFLENIIVIAAPSNHPLANKKGIKLKNLQNERFLSREQGSGTRQVFDRMMEKEGLNTEPYMELGSSEAIKQAVMAGLGIAVLSLYSLQLELDAGRLVLLDVKDFPVRRRWYAVHLKGKKLSLVAQTFLNFILQESDEVLDLDYLTDLK